MIQILKIIFYTSLLLLTIISLYPGSLIGLLIYEDLGRQPILIKTPFGSTINHFLTYFYVSLLGFFIYIKKENFKSVMIILIFLSVTLEFLQLFVPKRSFEFNDIVANILGLFVAYLTIKIYLLIKKL
jgi:VanZ family protein